MDLEMIQTAEARLYEALWHQLAPDPQAAGLTQEEINQINEPFDYDVKKMQHGNRGIGLRYVKAMLESFYEGETNLFVNCKKGYGTKITILISIQEELRNKIKFTGSETEKEGMEK